MDNFLDYYFDGEVFNMPIDLDLCSVNELGEMEIGLPLKYLSQLVEYDVIRLSRNGKKFKTLQEAYEHYDSLNEEEFNPKKKKDDKNKTVVTDPESGVERDFEVSTGNIKIGGDTVLLNMSTAGRCMSAIIGTCKLGANGQCYALRFEKQWADSLKKNQRHEEQWSCLTARGVALGLTQVSKAMPKVKYVRVNEAGEFRNLPADPAMLAKVPEEMRAKLAGVDDVGKLKEVGSELLKMGSDLILYTYTHRSDLDVGDMGSNVCINGSGYMLDNAFISVELNEFYEILDMVEEHTLKEFNGETVKQAVHCIGDCRVCNYCKTKTGKHIFLPIHGSGTDYQVELQKILVSVIETPEFAEIYSMNGSLAEKGVASLRMIPDEYKKTFTRLVPFRQDRIDLFMDIIKTRGNKELLSKAIEQYVKIDNGEGAVSIEITNADSTAALSKSVDALTGKFKASVDGAIASGKQASLKKWTALSNALNKAIETARSGKKPVITKNLAKQHAGVFGRLQKDMNQEKEV